MRRIVGVGDFEQTPNKNHPSYSRPCTSGTFLGSSSEEAVAASSAFFTSQNVQEGKMEERAKPTRIVYSAVKLYKTWSFSNQRVQREGGKLDE